tara:strand:+ start:545 stop:757 length:213 start_codon:yes stop_codon:yes gene_type:complete
LKWSEGSDICPDCKGKKSWVANRCQKCYQILGHTITGRPGLKNGESLRERLKEKIKELADEQGIPTSWVQ